MQLFWNGPSGFCRRIRSTSNGGEHKPLLQPCLFIHRDVIQANLTYISRLRKAVVEQFHLVAMRLDEFRMQPRLRRAHIGNRRPNILGICTQARAWSRIRRLGHGIHGCALKRIPRLDGILFGKSRDGMPAVQYALVY